MEKEKKKTNLIRFLIFKEFLIPRNKNASMSFDVDWEHLRNELNVHYQNNCSCKIVFMLIERELINKFVRYLLMDKVNLAQVFPFKTNALCLKIVCWTEQL